MPKDLFEAMEDVDMESGPEEPVVDSDICREAIDAVLALQGASFGKYEERLRGAMAELRRIESEIDRED